MKSRRKAIRSLTHEKVVNISEYRDLRNGRPQRRLAVVTTDAALGQGLKEQLQSQTEVFVFDSRFSLEQALKSGEWDGVLLDERSLHEDALSLCEKLKRSNRAEELFVVIASADSSKDLVRQGYEKGCDEWITKLEDVNHLARLLAHHLSN